MDIQKKKQPYVNPIELEKIADELDFKRTRVAPCKYDKLCKKMYISYKKLCKIVWDKTCTKDMTVAELNRVYDLAMSCAQLRESFFRECCKSKIDDRHLVPIYNMLELGKQCENIILDARLKSKSPRSKSPRSKSPRSSKSSRSSAKSSKSKSPRSSKSKSPRSSAKSSKSKSPRSKSKN